MCLFLLILIDWIDIRFHSDLITTFILLQIANIKFVTIPFPNIFNSEVIPLAMSGSLKIKINKEIIFKLTKLLYFPEIATIKSPIEKYGCLFYILGWKDYRILCYFRLTFSQQFFFQIIIHNFSNFTFLYCVKSFLDIVLIFNE